MSTNFENRVKRMLKEVKRILDVGAYGKGCQMVMPMADGVGRAKMAGGLVENFRQLYPAG